jgi:MFS family permease
MPSGTPDAAPNGKENQMVSKRPVGPDDRYRWVALANTTAAMFMATLDGSIVIIALPAIFRGIHLDPLAPGNIGYLLWMIMGYRLVQAVLVVTVGRLGDMFGRVKIYNAGFVVFTVASILLSFDPFDGGHGALWLIGWRVLQAIGGSMLMANSAAILTDAFPAEQRGFALGTNQIAGLAGMFVGLVAGGLLAAIDWRAVFWVNVPVGIYGTVWAYLRLRDNGERHRGRIDWWGNITFALGLSAVLVAVTYGIQPYGGHTMGWTSPWVVGGLAGGIALLVAFGVIETTIANPMFQLSLFRIRAFTAGNLAGLATSIARGGLQFMLIVWLQGIWLPLHGYNFSDTPLWAGIFLLPLTAGFLVAGPVSGILSDRFGSRGIATAGMAVFGGSFVGLMLLPVNFPYWAFALLIAANGIGSGMFAAPNSSSIMGSVPARQRGVASGMRSTFQNSGTALSIGVFFLPHDRRAGQQPPRHADRRPAAPRRAVGCRPSDRCPAPGVVAVRGGSRSQPGPAPAGVRRGPVVAAGRESPGAHRPPVLPAPDLRALPPGPDGGVRRRHRPGGPRRARVPAARRPLRPPRSRGRVTEVSARHSSETVNKGAPP